MKRAAASLLSLVLLGRCLPFDERLAACLDAGVCTEGAGGGSAGGSAGGTGGATAGGAGGSGGGATGGGSTGGGSSGGSGGGFVDAGTPRFTVMPAPLNFGNVEQNTTKDLMLTVTNTGDVTLAMPMADPENQLLFGVTNGCPSTLMPGGTCTMTVRYSPILVAQDDKRLTVSAAPAPDVMIRTLGTATPPGAHYEAVPANLTFGAQRVGVTTAVQSVTFRNTGMVSITHDPATTTSTDFAIVTDNCNTQTLANDGGCAVTVRFTASAEGTRDAELRFKPRSLPDLVVPLTGSGFALTQLTVTRTGIEPDAGRIYSDDGGIDCPGRCTLQAPRGTVVTLSTSELDGGSHFVEWFGSGCTTAASCTVTMTPDASVANARFDPYNRVFVYQPNVNGSLAPTTCTSGAMTNGLLRPGTSWVIGVNNGTTSIPAMLGNSRSWVRRDGIPYADFPADVMTSRVFSPPMVGPNGAYLNESLWTGVDRFDGGASADNCTAWGTTNMSLFGAQGSTQWEAGWWGKGTTQNCSTSAAVLCFEVGGRAPLVVPPRPAVSRLAFVSAGTVPGNTSQTAADAFCNTEAGTTSTNRFGALRAHPSGPLTIVGLDGGNWYRPDNVQIFQQPNDLTYPTRVQLSGISRLLDGGVLPPDSRVWTGGDPSPGAYFAANACNNWMAGAGTLGRAGTVNAVNSAAFDGLYDCGQQAHLYCFER